LLKTNKDSIHRVLHAAGVEMKDLPPVRLRHPRPRQHGRITEWLRRHGDKRLPRNYRDLALVIGVSYNALKQYFYRRRLAVKKQLEGLPDLRKFPKVVMEANDGKVYFMSQISRYKYTIDKFTLESVIVAYLKDREEAVFFPIPDRRAFANAIMLEGKR